MKLNDHEAMPLNVRERLIISQALYIAADEMEKREYPEHSNIADMRELGANKFPLYGAIAEASRLAEALNLGCGTTE